MRKPITVVRYTVHNRMSQYISWVASEKRLDEQHNIIKNM